MLLDRELCHKARLSRDARFDGYFFTCVKTTGIYCRSICPATPALEKNVEYVTSSLEAKQKGYRPCLRCRPDSAPSSPAWQGVDSTLNRALRLLNDGVLQDKSLEELALSLGVSSRYLRQLFQKRFGTSPKRYVLYQQCLFAKQLLQQSQLSITYIAFASGFKSLRRFNDCFKTLLGLAPQTLRHNMEYSTDPFTQNNLGLQLKLSYHPPYAWPILQSFYNNRTLDNLEWTDSMSYGRTFRQGAAKGYFTAQYQPQHNHFLVTVSIDNVTYLRATAYNIRRLLDLDTDTKRIEQHFTKQFPGLPLLEGLRLPGTWDVFEAGVRAILGQQVSVLAARKLLCILVHELGESLDGSKKIFPCAEAIAKSDLQFLKIPSSRRETLRKFATWQLKSSEPCDTDAWLEIKGIGRWTADYAAMRGKSNPDIWLAGDLGIKKMMGHLKAGPESAKPWRSYLTFLLWNS